MKRRSYSTILHLEGFAGSSVQDIARDMIRRAQQFDVPVSLDMNGTHLLAFPDSILDEIRCDYEAQLARTTTNKEAGDRG